MDKYVKRVWLNPDDCEATGSVVAFHGETERYKGRKDVSTFLEIADCGGKISLHKGHSDNMSEFINKLRLLASTATEFSDYLEKIYP